VIPDERGAAFNELTNKLALVKTAEWALQPYFSISTPR